MTEEEINDVFPFIKGERIDLIAGNSKWISLICQWHNDPQVRRYSRGVMPKTIEEIKKWFEPPPERSQRDHINFVIYHKIDKRPIGETGFGRIDWINRNANIYGTIGEPEYWGRGIIGGAAKLLINYGFTELNFHKIYAGIFNPNSRSLRAAEKLGFHKEGILKEQMYVDGEYVDEHKFALFKKDWIEQKK
ncbi:MAG: GNAT family N-acetyltransferase [Candidatus Lokiarchaeota archaeon]|nr:GNAT family N-acetyltransferase [Candidatus Lokiarchaeota archaeon]